MTEDLFFDTDCLSAFLWIDNTCILKELYKGRIIIPKIVYNELSHPSVPHLKTRIDQLLSDKAAKLQEIEIGTEEYKIYKSLKNIGKGEASGIALAATYNGILASNNYNDIAYYINKYNLKHLDTGMILVEALRKNLITKEDGDNIWSAMIAKNRILPTLTFTDYLNKYEKLNF